MRSRRAARGRAARFQKGTLLFRPALEGHVDRRYACAGEISGIAFDRIDVS